ncbi:SH3 domain-containing protein, partial [Limosilactobacillus agrestis]|uniref:SH3 domain-containing protein n=2 Tax=Limosilactobacillus agrestis TaxID=2759748 RepID=UPI001E5D402F
RVAYGLNIRQAPSTSAAIMAQYSGGQSFTYDSKVVANGYLWVSYMSYSGARRYVAIKNLSNGQTFGTDSNNFSYNNPTPSTSTPTPTPQPTPQPTTPADGTTMQQRGTFRVAYGLNIRQAPSTSAAIMAQYSGGQSFTYDS